MSEDFDNSRIVIGLGSGRSGTASLTYLWKGGLRSGSCSVGQGSYYDLNCVDDILHVAPEGLFVLSERANRSQLAEKVLHQALALAVAGRQIKILAHANAILYRVQLLAEIRCGTVAFPTSRRLRRKRLLVCTGTITILKPINCRKNTQTDLGYLMSRT